MKTWVLLAASSFLLFLIGLQNPHGYSFDEAHYVPSARQILEWRENQNWEHPPLGKQIMAISIGLIGDNPWGWRFASVIFGVLTLLGMYAWARALFKEERAALVTAGITLVNQLLYVQARIGMLDTFMFAFMLWGFVFFTESWNATEPKVAYKKFVWAGVCFGLSVACKWSAVVAWFLCLGIYYGVRYSQFCPYAWKKLPHRKILLSLGLIPLAIYFADFIPVVLTPHNPEYGFLDIFSMQSTMYDGQLRVVSSHPYMSTWEGWALMKRPIWYAYEKEPDGVRGVILLGNPLVMWGGLLALLYLVYSWLNKPKRDAFMILAAYSALYFSWAIIPRKICFYYYYYPAGMVLSLVLAACFQTWRKKNPKNGEWAEWAFLAASAGFFAYFFPILSGSKIGLQEFAKWMWFRSWI